MGKKELEPIPTVEAIIFKEVTNHAIAETRNVAVQYVTPEVVEAKKQEFALPKLYEFATPARQESVRVGFVILGTFGWAAICHWVGLSETVVLFGLGVIGGIYGLPKVVKEWRSSKSEPKALPPKAP